MREIAGKTPDKIKARTWKEFAGYDPFKDDNFDLDGTAERIAMVYGLTAEQVLDELTVDEIFPTFLDCVHHINAQVLRTFKDTPKKRGNDIKLTAKEYVLSFYLWGARELHLTPLQIDDMDLDEFLGYYILMDKINNPDDYRPGEYYFGVSP